MFRTSMDVAGKRAGRVAFGAVLIAGAAVLLHRLLHPSHSPTDAWLVVTVTWAAAFAAYQLAGRLAPRSSAPDRFATASLVLPSVGIALLLPLTIHMPFAMLMGGSPGSFDEWARLSVDIVGPAHLVLAGLAAGRAALLAAGRRAISPGTIYGLVILVSCLPGMFYLAIPPVLVALTGLPILPLLHRMQQIAEDDRASPQVPMAIAVDAGSPR